MSRSCRGTTDDQAGLALAAAHGPSASEAPAVAIQDLGQGSLGASRLKVSFDTSNPSDAASAYLAGKVRAFLLAALGQGGCNKVIT